MEGCQQAPLVFAALMQWITSMNKCLMVMVATGEVVCLHINKVVSGCFSLQFSVFFMSTYWIIAF